MTKIKISRKQIMKSLRKQNNTLKKINQSLIRQETELKKTRKNIEKAKKDRNLAIRKLMK